jgi:hypothetical protein
MFANVAIWVVQPCLKGGVSMEEADALTHDRRSFLGKLGKTLAVGLGFGLLTGERAGGTSNVCGIYCFVVSCGSGTCNNQPCSGNCFHCVSTPCGYDYWDCSTHACSSYCACPGCC